MYKKIEIDKPIRDFLNAPIPKDLIRSRESGRKKVLHYLTGSTVISMLDAAFGKFWDFEIIRAWKEESTPFQKKGETKSYPQPPYINVHGKLTIHLVDDNGHERTIVKSAIGTKAVVGAQSDQKDNYKAAATDCLKKAASLAGIGTELYRDDDEQAYFESINAEDPWTDEAMETYKEELAYIQELIDNPEIGKDVIDEAVSAWSGEKHHDIADLLPEEVGEFAKFLKEQESS